jgi:ArsR family transcriptional regulator, arsenate/arsenite/antimonite-responsive transcriptional repressor
METKSVIASLAALAQETRLAVYRLLVEAGPTGMSVGEIGAGVKSTPATLSFHLKELTHAGLISSRQDGRYVFYSANYQRMNDLLGFLGQNCCARDGLDCAPSCAAVKKRAPRAAPRGKARRT